MSDFRLKSTTVVVDLLIRVEVERPATDYDTPASALAHAEAAAASNVAKVCADAAQAHLQGKFTVCRVTATQKKQRVVSARADFEEEA